LYIQNITPHSIYLAFTSSADDPPGSSSIPIKPGEKFQTIPAIMYTVGRGQQMLPDSADYASQYQFLETAKREVYMWVSLNATRRADDRQVLAQGVMHVGSQNTTYLDRRGLEVAPIKAIEVEFGVTIPADVVASNTLHIDVRPHRLQSDAVFTFNTNILSPTRFAVQIVRTDQHIGWEDDLQIAWEAWSETQRDEPEAAPQVALRDWSEPTKLVWDAMLDDSVVTQANFAESNDEDSPYDFSINMTMAKLPGQPLLCSLYSKHVIKNLTGEDIDILDDGGRSVVVYPRGKRAFMQNGLHSPRSSGSVRLTLRLPATKMAQVATSHVGALAQESYLFVSEHFNLDSIAALEHVKLVLEESSADEFMAPAAAGGANTDTPTRPCVDVAVEWKWGCSRKLWRQLYVSPSLFFLNKMSVPLELGFVGKLLGDSDELVWREDTRKPTHSVTIGCGTRVPLVGSAQVSFCPSMESCTHAHTYEHAC
jgi:hypothetical protein